MNVQIKSNEKEEKLKSRLNKSSKYSTIDEVKTGTIWSVYVAWGNM